MFKTNLFSLFSCDEFGSTAIEYGLIAGSIAVAIASAVSLLGIDLKGWFEGIGEILG